MLDREREPDRPAAPDLLARARRPHLVGVAGTGMRSLATLLLEQGLEVSGSDGAGAGTLAALGERGIRVFAGHASEHVAGADLVIASAAVPPTNPELVTARAAGIPVMSHAQALGALMAARDGIGVAGTHGKSTTTALIAHILHVAGRDPTLVGGAESIDFGGSSRLGRGRELVAEADEFGRRFLELHPRIAAITGVEPDHLDYYGSFEAILAAFQQFVAGMPPDGVVVTCEDEPNLAHLPLARRRIRYGWAGHAAWRLERYRPHEGGGGTVTVRSPAGERRAFRLLLNGRHNAENAVAALAVAAEVGVSSDAAREALATFRGTRRRFETLAHADGIRIVDDYAIHPTEIAVTLDGARSVQARNVQGGRLVAIFQPHTAHRTWSLFDGLTRAFGDADRVIVTPIYQPAGRGADSPPVSAELLATRMAHPAATAVESLDAAYDLVLRELRPGDLVVVLGAGDVTTLAHRLAAAVRAGAIGPAAGIGCSPVTR